MEEYWAGICGTEPDWAFWSENLTWYTDKPRFTLCFQNTILSWFPVGVFLLIYPFYLWFLLKIPSARASRIGWMSVLKLLFCVGVIATALANLIQTIQDHSRHTNLPIVLFIQPVIDMIVMIVMMVTIVLERRKFVYSSALVFMFWCLFLVSRILAVASKAMDDNSKYSRHFHLVTDSIIMSFVFINFLLHCFSDGGKESVLEETDERTPLLGTRNPASARTENPCPEYKASALSRLTFSWIFPLVVLGYRRPLVESDLWDLELRNTSEGIVPILERDWKMSEERVRKREEAESLAADPLLNSSVPDVEVVQPDKNKIRVSLFGVLCRNFKSYALAGLYKLCSDSITFVQPQLLSLMIGFVSDKYAEEWHGYVFAVGLFSIAMSRTYILQQYFHGCYVTGMRLRTSIIGLVYRKAMRLSSAARKDKTVGEIVNLMSVDAQRLQDVPTFMHTIWTAPIQMIVAIAFLWAEIQISVLAGLAVLLLLIPLNGRLSYAIRNLQMSQMKLKDERIKVMNEVLNGVKVLKLYAWEMKFVDKIAAIREREVRILRKAAYLSCLGSISWFCAPFLVALSTFAVYVLTGHELTAQKAFVSLSLFNILQFPMSMLPGTINMLIQTSVSVKRINLFLESDELDPDAVDFQPAQGFGPSSDPVIMIRDGNFGWSHEETNLVDINFEVPQGKLVGVVGEVGSGKSSLVNAILGEMHKKSGEVRVKGRIAYVPQQAWCQNASLQDNILFGEPMSRCKYESVLEACALKPDLEVLPGGDQTEIGEKGINLSGGQKQRVSLARATYADADVYLFDDPLSAVDAHVGRHIFDQVLSAQTGVLRHKTRILVTHALSFLPQCDSVVVLRDGRIDAVGSYTELLAEEGAFAEFLREYLKDQVEEEEEEEEEEVDVEKEFKRQLFRRVSVTSDPSEGQQSRPRRISRQNSTRWPKCENWEEKKEEKQEPTQRLIEAETSETGSVKLSILVAYLSAMTFIIFIPLLMTFMAYIGSQVGTNIWLSIWSTAKNSTDPKQRDKYLGVYGALGASQAIVVCLQTLLLAVGAYRASRGLHLHLLSNIMRTPMAFFDTTPLGRILNRFSKDIDTVDISIPMTLRIWMSTFSSVMTTVIIVSYASPIFLVALVPLGICYYFMQRFYVCSSRQMKRMDSVKRSPIYSHFQESVIGASSIRSYQKTSEFIQKSDTLVDENQQIWYPNIVSYRWLGSFLETIGNFIILLSAIFAVIYREQMGPGVAGLSISYSLQVTSALSFMVRMSTDMETYIVAVERIMEYSEVPNEAALQTDVRPRREWPEAGMVTFRNYSVRYRPDLDFVLRSIDVKVNAGERVGIVGRTGAGKSSLTLALFRILEPSTGTIEIDGMDITKIGLHDLRSKITIIPQDPVLFSGTLRENLDPFGTASDVNLWRSLEQAGLHRFVSNQTEGLDYVVAEGGENLSVGQRQLVCLARALLRRTRVLVLDEATAAVDLQTDEFIQATIRSEFQGCTVLTIAHRLNTIMDYDRIMVLDKGTVKEMDTPNNLLANTNSIFYSMAREANLI